jgi:hypothetical protein
MKTPPDIAVMLGALSFVRVDGLSIYGGGRICTSRGSTGPLTGLWGITQGFTLIFTRCDEVWIRWNQDLPDIVSPKINTLIFLLNELKCDRYSFVDKFVFLRDFEQFNTQQLLSRINNPEWEPGI